MSEKQTYTKNEIDEDMQRSFAYHESDSLSQERRRGRKTSKLRTAGAVVLSAAGLAGGAHLVGDAMDYKTRPANPEAKIVHINVVDRSGQASKIAVHTDNLSTAQRNALDQGEQNEQLP